jgi:hypothetical protein
MAVRKEEIKQKLLEDVDRLPEEKLAEVLDFVGYLLTKTKKEKLEEHIQLDPAKDPLLKVIGIADVEPFGHEIDKELYGE